MQEKITDNSPTIRGVLIDPDTRSISVVQLPTAFDNFTKTYELEISGITQALGCHLFDIIHLSPDNTEDLYVDDEGRMTYPHPHGYFQLHNYITHKPAGGPICGRGLILGNNPATGCAVSSVIPAGFVFSTVRFLDTPPEETVEPRIEVTEWTDGEPA